MKVFGGGEFGEELHSVAYENDQTVSEYMLCNKGMMQTSTFVCQR